MQVFTKVSERRCDIAEIRPFAVPYAHGLSNFGPSMPAFHLIVLELFDPAFLLVGLPRVGVTRKRKKGHPRRGGPSWGGALVVSGIFQHGTDSCQRIDNRGVVICRQRIGIRRDTGHEQISHGRNGQF